MTTANNLRFDYSHSISPPFYPNWIASSTVSQLVLSDSNSCNGYTVYSDLLPLSSCASWIRKANWSKRPKGQRRLRWQKRAYPKTSAYRWTYSSPSRDDGCRPGSWPGRKISNIPWFWWRWDRDWASAAARCPGNGRGTVGRSTVLGTLSLYKEANLLSARNQVYRWLNFRLNWKITTEKRVKIIYWAYLVVQIFEVRLTRDFPFKCE